MKALPCPFCGESSVTIREGSTFRWILAECDCCGACSGETRRNTMKPKDGEEDTRRALVEWNTRKDKPKKVEAVREIERAVPDYRRLYEELIYQVGNKYPGESRHETALRYIRRAECGDSRTGCDAKSAAPKDSHE